MRRTITKILLSIPVAFTAFSIIYLGFFDGYKDVTVGRIHREAFDLFGDVDDVYEARIYLIYGEGKSDGTFPIRPYGRDDSTYGSIVLSGKDLEEFLEVWSHQEVSLVRQAMCHGPVYGFRLFRRGRATRETSICWECSNFYVEPYPGGAKWYGFYSDSEHAKQLLAFCDKRLPYKK